MGGVPALRGPSTAQSHAEGKGRNEGVAALAERTRVEQGPARAVPRGGPAGRSFAFLLAPRFSMQHRSDKAKRCTGHAVAQSRRRAR